MTTFVIVIHVLVSLMLILTVLLQPGNKGGMGAALGGAGGTTVFGGRGANTFLAKLTAGAAVVFMLTSFTLVYLSSKGTSAFDRAATPTAPATTTDTPASEAPATEGTATEAPATEGTATEAPATEGAAAPVEAPATEGAAAPAEGAAPAGE